MGVNAVIGIVGAMILGAVRYLNSTKETLDAVKAGTDIFGLIKRLLHFGAKDETPTESEIERARILTGALRGLAPLGLLEYLLWATKAVIAVFMVVRYLEWIQRFWSAPRT
jgi:hypothetical protein